jgi:serine/threonine-protein kinase
MEPQRSENHPSTVIISDRFGERRAQPARPDDASRALKPGDKLDRFVILSALGSGGMGLVYKAHDTELNRTVALKVLPPHLCEHPDYHNRFHAEAQAHARFNHPQIITLYAKLNLPQGEVLVLEYVEGQTLAQRLQQHGPLPVGQAVDWFAQALLGVEHMQRMGVVHRDLKPSNLFLTTEGQIKLMDFGVARLMDQHDSFSRGSMVGTLLYIAPEQINGRDTDFRSDIYTLGISLFEAVTGRLPFERRSDYALLHAHAQESPPRPKFYARRIPAELEWVILKAIEKDPNRRFQNAREFRTALLKLGLIERRHPTRAETGAPRYTPDVSTMNHSRRASRALLGGWGFDLFLIVAVAGLLLGLGIYPAAQPNLGTEAPVVKPRAANTTRNVTAVKPRAAQPATKPPAVESAPAAPRKDKYESLRQAWGE